MLQDQPNKTISTKVVSSAIAQSTVIMASCMAFCKNNSEDRDFMYLSRNYETREDIPQNKDEEGENGSYLLGWCECDCHHPVKCEVGKA